MIMSLSDDEKNINSALNSLDVARKMSYITDQAQNAKTMSLKMSTETERYRDLIQAEVNKLLDTVSTLEEALHFYDNHTQDDILAQCREILNSFDPNGKITDSNSALFL